MTAQHGAAEPLQPGPLEISEMLAAPYERQGTRNWTGRTQTSGDPSKARLPDFGVSLFPRCFFFLFRPSIDGDFLLLYEGCAEKDVTTIHPLALQASLPSPGWRRLGPRAGTGRHARAADTGMSTPAGKRPGPVPLSPGVLAVPFHSHGGNQVEPSPLYR